MKIQEIDTPALLVDLDAMEHNLACMAGFFADKPELPLPMPDKSGSAVIVKL